MPPAFALTARSLAQRVLFYSRDESLLDSFERLAGVLYPWDICLAITHVAAVDELRHRHVDVFVTDEPSWILILHERFPNDAAREFIVQHFFRHEYLYLEFLREYGERFRELSGGTNSQLPTVLVVRNRNDPVKHHLYDVVRAEATAAVAWRSRESVGAIAQAVARILGRS